MMKWRGNELEFSDPGNQEAQQWYALGPAELVSALETDPDRGLGAAEVEERLQRVGLNQLPEAQSRSPLLVYLRQFQSPLIYLLFIAAVFALVLGEYGDAVVILVVVFINAIVGGFQEGRAARSMAALRKLSALQARVIRDGEEKMIEARYLAPGDILLLEAGDAVGADARLLESAAAEVAEAALTGESLPVRKQVETLPAETLLADRRNMLYAGTHLTAGRCRAMVVATGLFTEVGGIARMTEGAESLKTPLERRIAQFGRYLAMVAVLLFAAVMSIGLLRGFSLAEIFMVAISQMVSMVPEGLPVAMTIALAIGMQRMGSRGAIVRRLAAVETLGSTSVICTDKTGTLTRNEMTVTALCLPDGGLCEVSGAGYAPEGVISQEGEPCVAGPETPLRVLFEAAALCNDASLIAPDPEDERWRALGDPTEAALLTLAAKGGVDLEDLRRACPREAELPFDPASRLMATAHRGADGQPLVFLKGAPEAVMGLADHNQAQMLEIADAMAARALRVLACGLVPACRLDPAAGFAQFQGRVQLLGLVGQMDPPRDEVRLAVDQCRAAGIRPVMVTGDHKATGLAIARALGIAGESQRAVDGRELEAMAERDLRAGLDDIAVFARVHPAQKLRIVEAFQSRESVVAMTGDGVNDAPALAQADVGVAMGITGTEVAKSAADIVITDDNFSTIVRAVEQGRLVYRNLKKVILYLFATSMAEITVLLGALLGGYPLPLAAVQILWINIVTEGTVTVNLVLEPPEGDEMGRPPAPRSEPILDRGLLKRVALMTPVMGLSTLLYFIWRLDQGAPHALVQTETFTVLAACQWFNVLNCRSATNSALNLGIFRNKWLFGGLLVGMTLQMLVIYWPPLSALFHTVPIPMGQWLPIILAASSVLWLEELRKLLGRRPGR